MESAAKRIARSGLMFWIALAIIGMYFLYPLRKSLRFGIDLVGGSYLTLEVKTDTAIEAELIRNLNVIVQFLLFQKQFLIVKLFSPLKTNNKHKKLHEF